MPEPKGSTLYEGPFASFYDHHFGHHALELAPRLLRFWADPPNGPPLRDLLDLGCGAGHLDLPFLEAGYRVTGLDLSNDMLEHARRRCARYLPAGQARFLQGDMAGFDLGRVFGSVVSSYNCLNHLEDPGRLRDCFRSARRCLDPKGSFLFDFHTLRGLRGWARAERTRIGEEEIEVSGGFEEKEGRAWMDLRIRGNGGSFRVTLWNHSFPLDQVTQWLQAEGFTQVLFSDLAEVGREVPDPGKLDRVLVIARP